MHACMTATHWPFFCAAAALQQLSGVLQAAHHWQSGFAGTRHCLPDRCRAAKLLHRRLQCCMRMVMGKTKVAWPPLLLQRSPQMRCSPGPLGVLGQAAWAQLAWFVQMSAPYAHLQDCVPGLTPLQSGLVISYSISLSAGASGMTLAFCQKSLVYLYAMPLVKTTLHTAPSVG